MLVGVFSPKGTYDTTFLGNYAYISLNDPIARLYGVGQTQVFGAGQYAMRLWVQPDKLAKLGITVTDIVNAVQAQNKVNPAGQVGGEPTIHLFRACARPPVVPGTIRECDRARDAGWWNRSCERRRSRRAWRAGLQHCQPPKRQARHRHSCLPVAGVQRRPNGRRRSKVDGRDEAELSARYGLRHIAGPDRSSYGRHERDR